MIFLLVFFSHFTAITRSNSLVAAELTNEEGKAHINRVICTDSGQCLIFYYRSKSVSDTGSFNGPYVKACKLTPSGEFTNLSSSILLNASADIINSIDIYEVQENSESIRLIGLDGKILYEIWWFKSNNSAIVKERNFGKTFAYGVFSRRSQWPYINQIQNYSLVGLETSGEPTDNYQLIKVNLDSVERIPIEITREELDFNGPMYYLFDGNNSIYMFDYNFNYDQLRIRRLFLNGTVDNYITLYLPPSMYARKEYLFIGRDENPYFGFMSFGPNSENSSIEEYTHTFSITNIISKQTFAYSFTSLDNSFRWDLLIDSTSNTHVILHTYPLTQYLKFLPDYTLSFDSILELPETGNKYIKKHSFTLYQDRYILGGLEKENKDAGVFVIDIDNGELISVNSSLIQFINYSQEYSGSFEYFLLLPSLIILVLINRRKNGSS